LAVSTCLWERREGGDVQVVEWDVPVAVRWWWYDVHVGDGTLGHVDVELFHFYICDISIYIFERGISHIQSNDKI